MNVDMRSFILSDTVSQGKNGESAGVRKSVQRRIPHILVHITAQTLPDSTPNPDPADNEVSIIATGIATCWIFKICALNINIKVSTI